MTPTADAIPVTITITITATPCPSGQQYQTSCVASAQIGDRTVQCKAEPIREFVRADWLTHYERIDLWLGKQVDTHQGIFVSLKPAMRALRALIKRNSRGKPAKPPQITA